MLVAERRFERDYSCAADELEKFATVLVAVAANDIIYRSRQLADFQGQLRREERKCKVAELGVPGV